MRQSIFLLLVVLSIAKVDAQEQAGLLGTWSDDSLVGSSAFDNTYNEIWGIVANGVEYAIIGSTLGTHFINISDPSSPVEDFVVEGGSTGPSIIHRDYHDYNGFLYAVSDEGSRSTLQIMDFSYLPDSVSVIYDSGATIRQSHNIFIDTTQAILYACNTNSTSSTSNMPLRLFDISDPADPQVISEFRRFDNLSVSQVHDAYVNDGIAYLNCGPHGLVIADFEDPTAPQTLSILSPNDYPQSGYNHSGWLSEDGNTYYMADETWDTDIKVFDVTDKNEITVIDTIDAGSENRFSIAHNQIVHGDYFYSAYYYDGIQVWDVSDLDNIERVVEYSTTDIDYRRSYEGAWGVYPFLPSGNFLVSDMQNGLFVFEPVATTVSTNEPITSADLSFKIYPNPSNGRFSIINKGDSRIDRVEIYNNSGQLIHNADSTTDIKLDLIEGIYQVKIYSGNSYATKPLLIAH